MPDYELNDRPDLDAAEEVIERLEWDGREAGRDAAHALRSLHAGARR